MLRAATTRPTARVAKQMLRAPTKKEEASSKDEIKDLYIARNAVRELETFNILYTQASRR